MAGELVREGVISAAGVHDLLRAVELERTSGVLRFESDGSWREIALVAGQLAVDDAACEGPDPVEALLAARAGRFEVLQRLPPLAVSKGDTRVRTGSLAVHVPADLMIYCERAGLTGTLEFVRGDERAEAVYDKGELTAIQYGGGPDGDVNAVFAWEDGSFKIEALPVVPELDLEALLEPPQPAEEVVVSPSTEASNTRPARRDETVPITRRGRRRRDETGQNFLRIIETTLGAVVEEAERRRSPTRTSPPLATLPSPRAESVPPVRPSRESTVRIIYLTGESVPAVPVVDVRASTRHVRTDVAGEAMLPDASPERVRLRSAVAPPAQSPRQESIAPRNLWLALGGLVLALGALSAAVMWLLRAR
jgi:hypothetical protein